MLASSIASADLVTSDLLTTDDNRVVLDMKTNVEWLTLDGRFGETYLETLSKTAYGQEYQSFRLATQSEVETFLHCFSV